MPGNWGVAISAGKDFRVPQLTHFSLAQLAESIGGSVEGDVATVVVHGAAPLQDALAGDISLVDNEKHLAKLLASPAAAFVVPNQFPVVDRPLVRVDNPHAAFIKIIDTLRPPSRSLAGGIHPQAHVEASAAIGAGTSVGPGVSVAAGVTIGERCHIHAGVHIQAGCRIGSDCEIYPGVVLYENTIVEDRVLIHAGAILGSFGFGYKLVQGRHCRTAQLGWVHVESDVEIGAGVTIDRGTYGATRIGEGTKIDNQVQIAHNCHIGKHNLICAQVGIAGSCSTGNYVVLAGQVGMKDHIHLADGVVVGAQAGLMGDVPAGQVLLGSPALPQKEQMQIFALQKRLPEMRKQLKQLQATVDHLQSVVDIAKTPPCSSSLSPNSLSQIQ
jgi:UDP-3-O-[3-hydroxymyristoyl] glucosamine N-acyltransferase